MEKKRHEHYDMIVAWANGEQIQFKNMRGKWETSISPSWSTGLEYRVKPKLSKLYGRAFKDHKGDIEIASRREEFIAELESSIPWWQDGVKWIGPVVLMAEDVEI